MCSATLCITWPWLSHACCWTIFSLGFVFKNNMRIERLNKHSVLWDSFYFKLPLFHPLFLLSFKNIRIFRFRTDYRRRLCCSFIDLCLCSTQYKETFLICFSSIRLSLKFRGIVNVFLSSRNFWLLLLKLQISNLFFKSRNFIFFHLKVSLLIF